MATKAWRLTAEQDKDGKKSTIEAVLVRKGTTIASFTATTTSGPVDKRTEVVGAQLKKLN
ncbi:hypothetical protein ACFWB1_05590 [Streptomyces goshikiensis]|uniref:hypothetical protein n=1 Tax=Streptomyces goshikiensis TaxID=1942 RepID=UPI0036D0B428